MINIDKYEGHTEGEWYAYDGTDTHGFGWEVLLPTHKNKSQSINVTRLDECMLGVRKNTLSKVDAQLIADAPLLLQEVKRLREILGDIVAIDEWGGDGKEVGITITFTEGGSFSGWLNKDDEVIE
jgi:hypothetical protein